MHLTTLALLGCSFSGLGQTLMTQGLDIDGSDGTPDWEAAYKDGARLATIRATSGDLSIDQLFATYWADSEENGFIRAPTHSGLPAQSTAQEQAEFFLGHGGRWVDNNKTLPGILEMIGPEGNECWGLDGNETRQFLTEWTDTYFNATGRWPYIYTSLSWFDQCTNHWHSFPINAQLALFDEDPSPPNDRDLLISYGVTWSMWQNGSYYEFGGYSNMFHGNYHALQEETRMPEY